MKKEYMKPEIQVITIKSHSHLLQSSLSVKMGKTYEEEDYLYDMEDL